MLEEGADGYLTKDELLSYIIEAVIGVANGQKGWMSRKATELLMLSHPKNGPSNLDISPRETDVVEKITEGKTNKQIALALEISEKTVEKHVYKLFRKFGAVSRVQLAVIAVRKKSLKIRGR